MPQLLIVEGDGAWKQHYKQHLPGFPLDVHWVDDLCEANRYWNDHSLEIEAVILDEHAEGRLGWSGPPSFASKVIADWKDRKVNGVLVIAANSSKFRDDMPLAGCVYRGIKPDAVGFALEHLQTRR